jgi:predicted ester cyclase
MSTELNRATARRFYEDVLNRDADGMVAGLQAVCAADFIHHDNALTRGLKDYQRAMAGSLTVFSASRFAVDEVVAEGDAVVVRWTWRGTQTGEWAGIAPTQREARGAGLTLFHFQGEKVLEAWSCWDTYALRKG